MTTKVCQQLHRLPMRAFAASAWQARAVRAATSELAYRTSAPAPFAAQASVASTAVKPPTTVRTGCVAGMAAPESP
jgi:hypothetical protein